MEEYLNLISVPAIVCIVYWVMNVLKYTFNNNEKFMRLIPICSGVLGLVCGVIAFYAMPAIMPATNVFVAMLIGASSGLTATGANQIIKQFNKTICEKQELTNNQNKTDEKK